MITQTVTVETRRSENIIIGRRGTYGTEAIAFDVTSLVNSYGDGVAVLMVKRPTDTTAYPVVTTREENVILWEVSDIDTAYKGHGECELFWYVDDSLAKSIIYSVAILRDIGTTDAPPPDPYETWIETLTELGAETLENAQNAAQSATDANNAKVAAENAQTAAETAQERAEQAQRGAESAESNAEGYASTASTMASQAQRYAEQAAESASSAQRSAESASDSASTASNKASQAYTSATQAAQSATQAGNSATTASNKATQASNAANSAEESATTASDKADEARSYANTATTQATLATNKATEASNSAGAAYTSAQTAAGKAQEASDSATVATNKAGEASTSATNAHNSEVAAQTAQGLAEAARTAAEAAAAQAESALDTKADVIIDHADGAIASFADGANDAPIKDMTVAINPVQDLHGYAKPWPAGGGTNILDPSSLDEVATNSRKWHSTDGGFTLKANTKYTFSVYNTTSTVALYFYAYGGSSIVSGTRTVSYTPTVDTVVYLRAYYSNGITDAMQFQLEIGDQSDKFYTYSNICPISGYTGLSLYDDPAYGGTINFNQNMTALAEEVTKSGITFTPNADGSISFSGIPTTSNIQLQNFTMVTGHIYAYKRKSVSGKWAAKYNNYYQVSADYDDYRIITASSTSPECGIYCDPSVVNNTNISGTFFLMLFDLTQMFGAGNEPTVDEFKALFPHDYYPYNSGEETLVSKVNGDPYGEWPVTWQDEAGTVYSANLHINEDGSGVLTVTLGMQNLGLLSWTYLTGASWQCFYASLSGKKNGELNLICSNYATDYIYGTNTNYIVGGNAGSAFIYVRDTSFNGDANAFTTAMSGVQLCYELATPITYNLSASDIGVITTVLGVNNIWANTGDTSVDFRADTKLYIEQLTQPTEDNLIADHAITSGTFFMIGNSLYLATANIANGATITIGTNATRLSLADALNRLNS